VQHRNGEGPEQRGDGAEAQGFEHRDRRLEVLPTAEKSPRQERFIRAEGHRMRGAAAVAPRLISISASAVRAREWRRKKREAAAAADVGMSNSAKDVPNRPNGVANGVASAPNSTANATNRAANDVHERSRCDLAIGLGLIVIAVLLAGVGTFGTVSYSLTTAAGADRLALAALALGADLLTLMLPAAIAAAWRHRQRGLALAAALMWFCAAAVTAANLCGFVGLGADRFVASREVAGTERATVLELLAKLRAERAGITEGRPTDAIIIAIRNSTKSRIDEQRSDLAEAKRRDAIDAELGRLSSVLPTLPAVADADPLASTVTAVIKIITGGVIVIADRTVARARVILLLVLPLFSGSLLALGVTLLGARADGDRG
jgi:hypothetical protein